MTTYVQKWKSGCSWLLRLRIKEEKFLVRGRAGAQSCLLFPWVLADCLAALVSKLSCFCYISVQNQESVSQDQQSGCSHLRRMSVGTRKNERGRRPWSAWLPDSTQIMLMCSGWSTGKARRMAWPRTALPSGGRARSFIRSAADWGSLLKSGSILTRSSPAKSASLTKPAQSISQIRSEAKVRSRQSVLIFPNPGQSFYFPLCSWSIQGRHDQR